MMTQHASRMAGYLTRSVRPRLLAAALAAGLAATTGAGQAVANGATIDDTGAPLAPLVLKQTAIVVDGEILLSDLFLNVPSDRDMVIAKAPKPGGRLALSARQLMGLAQSAKLPWRPQAITDTIVVTRDSRRIPSTEVENAIAGAVADIHGTEDFDVDLFDTSLSIHAPSDSDGRILVSDLDYDARTQQFRATVTVIGAGLEPTSVAGRVVPMIEIPVLARHFMPGEIIRDNDVEWRRVPARQATITSITRLDDLVGHTPRRPLAAGRGIRMTDVVPDYVIQKGDLVSVVIKTHNMTLSARGQALKRGAKGDIIRVRNVQSRKTIEAKVIGPDLVAVEPAKLAALN